MSRRACIAAVAMIVYAGAPAASAEDKPIIDLRLDYSSGDNDLTDRRNLFGAALEARWQPALGDGFKAVLDGRVGSLDFARGDGGHVRINEAVSRQAIRAAPISVSASRSSRGAAPTASIQPTT